MKTAKQWAREIWCRMSLGNIAVPANADAAGRFLTPEIEAVQREAIEAAAHEAEYYAAHSHIARTIAADIRALVKP